MKKLLLIITLTLMSSQVKAQTCVSLGFGLATPNDKINAVYNSDRLKSDSGVYSLFSNSTSLGYNIAARVRFSLGDDILFSGGIGFARFPESSVDVRLPGKDSTPYKLKTTQNVVPVSAGVEYVLFRKIISPYIAAELQYNYINSTVDVAAFGVDVPLNIDTAPVDNRVGAALGAGMMLDLALITLNVDARYHMMNIIGRTTDEKSKSYLSFNIGIIFGWK